MQISMMSTCWVPFWVGSDFSFRKTCKISLNRLRKNAFPRNLQVSVDVIIIAANFFG